MRDSLSESGELKEEFQVDRSRIIEAQACPRKRYLGYHYGGTGIQRFNKSLPLLVGGSYHEGIAVLLQGGNADEAVEVAVWDLRKAFEASGVALDGEPADSLPFAQQEQLAFVEAMVRAFALREATAFLRDFDIVQVETEGRVEIGEGIELMFRPDAVVREKLSGDVYVLSLKSCSSYSQMTFNQCQVDMQSLSEVFGVEKSLGIRVEGVLYKHIVKGRRSLDEYSGQYRQDSPLIYGWLRKGPTPEDDEWAWKYGWATEEVNEKTGKMVGTKLGKGFRKVAVVDSYPGGVKVWVEALAAQEVEPRHLNALEAIFPQSLPVSRRAEEIESWKNQVVSQEARIKYHLGCVDANPHLLDNFFPQHTANCFSYASRCPYWNCCFTPAVKADPMASGLYQIRVPNHPSEKGDAE